MATLAEVVLSSVTLVGLVVTVASGYLIVRGPFLGGATLEPMALLAALGVFVVGVVVTAWSGTKYVRAR
ncbi:hypothetical protein ACFQJD_09955 [Haloplanus sp. GCM10025708]|uniref:hypothetical protein n=1 Tax=Haloferacaceae TaxID=1644056 RepID=UPI003623E7A2